MTDGMTQEDLIHDAALATATTIVEYVGAAYSEEEQQRVFDEIYARVHAGIKAFCIQQARARRRSGQAGINERGSVAYFRM